ncbi:MAG: carboxypeptidase-like regulatory domain-containing protein [Cyclobacteriaceae bacterium]
MKNNIKLIISAMALFMFEMNFAQSHIRLAGQVLTSSGTPASFAHVFIKNKNMGGTTDLEGYFKYFIPEDYLDDQVQITFVGFKTYEIPVRDLIVDQDKVLVLEENVVQLDNVTIYAPQEIMRTALKSIVEENDPSQYYSRSGIVSLNRKEGEDYSLLEEIAFNYYYRGMLGERELIGYEPTAQRRSIDYSTFPYILPRGGGTRTTNARFFFGGFVESFLIEMAEELDSLNLTITDLVEVEGKKFYVITRGQKSGGLINCYVSLDQNQLHKVEFIANASQISEYVGGSPFDNSKFNRFRYLYRDTYWFETVEGKPIVSKIQHVTKTQYIERLTGYIHRIYDDRTSIKFLEYTPLSEQPKKYRDKFKIPIAIDHDADFWNRMKHRYDHSIDAETATSLSEQQPIESQFIETNGRVILGDMAIRSSFSKKDQKKQSDIEDIERFIDALLSNSYEADYPPKLSWKDIPELLEIADSRIIIDRFPRNILSRLYLKDCQTGIVALWLIDSIRKNEGKKVRKAWYVSPMPLLQNESDREISRARGGGNEYIPANSDEKLATAFEAFEAWWKNAQDLSRSKSKRVNPLQGSELNWLWR